jgi:hypothetical protein
MANPERRNVGERTGEFFRNLGIVGGLIGILAMIAGLRIGGTIFVAGAATGVAGEVGRRIAKPQEKKA